MTQHQMKLRRIAQETVDDLKHLFFGDVLAAQPVFMEAFKRLVRPVIERRIDQAAAVERNHLLKEGP